MTTLLLSNTLSLPVDLTPQKNEKDVIITTHAVVLLVVQLGTYRGETATT